MLRKIGGNDQSVFKLKRFQPCLDVLHLLANLQLNSYVDTLPPGPKGQPLRKKRFSHMIK
jgi:hypothetical protein